MMPRPAFIILNAILIALTLPALTACAGDLLNRGPRVDVTLDRLEDSSAALTLSPDALRLDVTDNRGINGLTARLDSGSWPEAITVHLRLAGLENLEIQYGNYTITTGRSSNESPDPPLMLSVVDEHGQVQTASPSADIYYPDISRTDDGYTITMPPHFFQDHHETFSLRWIDFYR